MRGKPFSKGVSGNPGGRPRQDPEVCALCEKFTPAAIATLAEIMGNKKAQPSARVAAAMAILKKTLPDLASKSTQAMDLGPLQSFPRP